MVDGEVGFHNEKLVRKIKVPMKNGPLVRKLEKSKKEVFPDLRKEKEDRDAEEERELAQERKMKKKTDAQIKKEMRKKAMEDEALREYRDVFANEDAITTTKDMSKMTAEEFEDDFM
jgi:hypothetical protein